MSREHFAIGDVSVSAQAARLKAADPDAIVVTCVGTPLGTALRGLRDGGLENVPVMTNFGNLIHAELEQFGSFVPERLYLTAPRFVTYDVSGTGPVRDAQGAFYEALRAKGIEPDAPHSLSWDPAFIVVDALPDSARARRPSSCATSSKRTTATPERSAFSIFATGASAASAYPRSCSSAGILRKGAGRR